MVDILLCAHGGWVAHWGSLSHHNHLHVWSYTVYYKTMPHRQHIKPPALQIRHIMHNLLTTLGRPRDDGIPKSTSEGG